MTFRFAVVALLAASPLAAQGGDLSSASDPMQDTSAVPTYRTTPYHAVRRGEVQSAGFLTELQALPFGKVLGPVDPPVVHSTASAEAAMTGTVIAVQPPSGAAYQRGDTVLLAQVLPGPGEWGDIVVPTGLALVGDHTPRQTLASVIAMYGPIRAGQVVLPLAPVPVTSSGAPNPVNGPAGEIITSQEPREFAQAGGIMFINIGRAAGMHLGDFVQVRRRPTTRIDGPDTIDDLMAVGQVVHVGDKSSTIRLTRIVQPDIRPGTPVVRIATLPG